MTKYGKTPGGNSAMQKQRNPAHGKYKMPGSFHNSGFSTYFFLTGTILVSSQARMLDQTRQLMQMLKPLFQGRFGQLAQGQLISVVPDTLQDRIEMILVEHQLHESLRLARELAVNFWLIFVFFFLDRLVFVILITSLEEGILALLCRL
jgi:hypothetical protein